jgi:Mob1/phocein family
MRQLTNIFRRVYRIFAHAWFQHRAMFWQVEGRTGLYIFFKTVCDVYGLIPEDNYTVPPEAEGAEADAEGMETRSGIVQRNNEEERHSDTAGNEGRASSEQSKVLAVGNVTISTGHTTKRHRQTPSVDAGAISTVIEEIEEEDPKGDKKMPMPEEKHTEPGKEDPTETGQESEDSKVANPDNAEPDIEVAEEPVLNGPPEEGDISRETTASSASDEPAMTVVIDPGNEAKPEERKANDFESVDSAIAEKLKKAVEPADADHNEDTQPAEEKAEVEVADFASKTEAPTTEDTPEETDATRSESDGKEKASEASKS